MTQPDQIQNDLRFVRDVVTRHDQSPHVFVAPYYIWAVYVLIGYSLLDINASWANWFFMLAWFPAVVACGIAGHFLGDKTGERDHALHRKQTVHFFAGSVLAIGAVIALAICNPVFRGPVTGQVIVIMLGIIYFLAGVHLDKSFLWLGPVLVVGGIVVGFIPHHGWTALGAVIAAGLCAAALLSSRRQRLFEVTEN